MMPVMIMIAVIVMPVMVVVMVPIMIVVVMMVMRMMAEIFDVEGLTLIMAVPVVFKVEDDYRQAKTDADFADPLGMMVIKDA